MASADALLSAALHVTVVVLGSVHLVKITLRLACIILAECREASEELITDFARELSRWRMFTRRLVYRRRAVREKPRRRTRRQLGAVEGGNSD
jgi:hypothetical protein